jgi:hypothetical protein
MVDTYRFIKELGRKIPIGPNLALYYTGVPAIDHRICRNHITILVTTIGLQDTFIICIISPHNPKGNSGINSQHPGRDERRYYSHREVVL